MSVNPTHCTICGFKWDATTKCHNHAQVITATPPPPPIKKTRAKKDPKRHIKTVKVSNMQKQLRTILAREIDRLMDASYDKLLDRDQAVSLRGYIDLANELEELDKIKTLEQTKKDDK